MTKIQFIFICIFVLIPIGAILLNWALYLFGKYVWWLISGYYPSVSTTLDLVKEAGNDDFLYYETSIIILSLICAILIVIV